MNGKFCKDPKLTEAEDFFFSGLDKPGNTSNPVASNVTTVNVEQIKGLNTLGISMVRIDYDYMAKTLLTLTLVPLRS